MKPAQIAEKIATRASVKKKFQWYPYSETTCWYPNTTQSQKIHSHTINIEESTSTQDKQRRNRRNGGLDSATPSITTPRTYRQPPLYLSCLETIPLLHTNSPTPISIYSVILPFRTEHTKEYPQLKVFARRRGKIVKSTAIIASTLWDKWETQ